MKILSTLFLIAMASAICAGAAVAFPYVVMAASPDRYERERYKDKYLEEETDESARLRAVVGGAGGAALMAGVLAWPYVRSGRD